MKRKFNEATTVAIPASFRRKKAWLIVEKDQTPPERADDFHQVDYHMGLIPVDEPFDQPPNQQDILFIAGAIAHEHAMRQGLSIQNQRMMRESEPPENRWEALNKELQGD